MHWNQWLQRKFTLESASNMIIIVFNPFDSKIEREREIEKRKRRKNCQLLRRISQIQLNRSFVLVHCLHCDCLRSIFAVLLCFRTIWKWYLWLNKDSKSPKSEAPNTNPVCATRWIVRADFKMYKTSTNNNSHSSKQRDINESFTYKMNELNWANVANAAWTMCCDNVNLCIQNNTTAAYAHHYV